jgi:hypothetical protein
VIYKKYIHADGTVRYRDKTKNVFVSTKTIPANVMELLRYRDEVDDTDLPSAPAFRKCIYCDSHSKYERFINLQTVYLCDEHYYSKSIGQVAQQLNKEKVNA